MLTHKKGGSEVERTGTLHSASPPKYRCVSAGPRPPAALDGDKDGLMRPESTFSHLPQGVWRMPLQAGSGDPTAEGQINMDLLYHLQKLSLSLKHERNKIYQTFLYIQ